MTKLLVKSLTTTNTVEFLAWCRKFHLSGPRRPSIDRRFSIGFYQVYQALKWCENGDTDNPNYHESLMASVVHLTCVAEALDIDLYPRLYRTDLKNIVFIINELNYKETLLRLAQTQQMLVYLWAGSSSRTTRYSKTIVEDNLIQLILSFIMRVPKNKRLDALEHATEIMSGTL